MLRELVRGSLSVGLPEIDREHEEFASLAAELIGAVAASKPAAAVAEIVGRLVRHAFDHFTSEERVLVGIGYAEYDPETFTAHVDEHNRLKLEIQGVLRRPEFAVEDALSIQVMLADHLVRWDVKFKSYAEWARREGLRAIPA